MLTEKDHLVATKRRYEHLIEQKRNEIDRLMEALRTLNEAELIIDGHLPNMGEEFHDGQKRKRLGNGKPREIVYTYLSRTGFGDFEATAYEIAKNTGLALSTVVSALKQLVGTKLVERVNKKYRVTKKQTEVTNGNS